MPTPQTMTTAADLSGIAPGRVLAEYRDRGIEEWDDHQLVAAAGRVLAVPRAAPADSFVLHAPLELIGRAALLPLVDPDARERARTRIVALSAAFEAAGDPVDAPATVSPRPLDALARELIAAIGSGDLDAVDRYAAQLGVQAKPHDLARLLGEALAPSLAARVARERPDRRGRPGCRTRDRTPSRLADHVARRNRGNGRRTLAARRTRADTAARAPGE
jgi:hypothetical protein